MPFDFAKDAGKITGVVVTDGKARLGHIHSGLGNEILGLCNANLIQIGFGCEEEKWMEYLCIGVLNAMLVGPPTPVNCFRCEIDSINFHDIDSSKQAFRLAGRYAAQSFLAQAAFNKLWGYKR